MKKWLRKIMYSCSYTTYLTEKEASGQITFTEKLRLKFHRMGCAACRMYSRQSAFIDKAIRKLYEESDYMSVEEKNNSKSDEQGKKELQEWIENKWNKN